MIDFSPVCVFGSEHIALALVALVGTTRHGWLRKRVSTVGSINMQGRRVAFDPVCVFGSENACVLTLVALVALVGWLRERESVHGGSINMQEGRRSEQSLAAHSLLHPFTADYFSPVYP